MNNEEYRKRLADAVLALDAAIAIYPAPALVNARDQAKAMVDYLAGNIGKVVGMRHNKREESVNEMAHRFGIRRYKTKRPTNTKMRRALKLMSTEQGAPQ